MKWGRPHTRLGNKMPDAKRLCLHEGELGPICDFCEVALTFGKSMIVDQKYACWDCYLKETEATPSTEGKKVDGLVLD